MAGACVLALLSASCATTGGREYTEFGVVPDTIIYAVSTEQECGKRLQIAEAVEFAEEETVVVQPRRLCMTHSQILTRCIAQRMLIANENLARIDMRSGMQADAYGSGSYANGMGALTLRVDRQTRQFCSYVQREYQRVRHVATRPETDEPTPAPDVPDEPKEGGA